MYDYHRSTKQCRLAYEKIDEKTMEECGFAPAKHETLDLSQCMQKCFEHHGM
jgi:hypothetical protein